MIVNANDMGSRLAAGNVLSFEMRKFRGSELRSVWETKPKNPTEELIAFSKAIRDCIDPESCNVDDLMNSLTIYDTWQLVVMQWQASGVPMALYGTCQHPVYHYVDAKGNQSSEFSAADVPEGAKVLSVDSCGHRASSNLLAHDVEILYVASDCMEKRPVEDIEFPMLRHLFEDDYDITDKTHLLMMALSEHDIDEMEASDFMKTSRWLSDNVHGVRNNAFVLCPHCARQSTTTWDMGIRRFLE